MTRECESYLEWYIEKLAEEFTYHYIQLTLGWKGYEPETYLTAHPKPIDDRISTLTPHEKQENLKAVVRLVGRFQAKVAL